MSGSGKLIIVAAVVLSMCPLALSAVSLIDTGKLALAQRLVHLAFPELLAQRARLRITIDEELARDVELSGLVGVRIVMPSARPHSDAHGDHEKELLSGLLLIHIPAGYIEDATFSGEHLHSSEMNALTAAARSHGDWNDADIVRELQKVGGKFGPARRTAFLEHTRIDRFRELLGRIETQEVKFVWRLGTSLPPEHDVMVPAWLASLKTTHTNNVSMCYGLAFEPIDGRLTHLSGRPCD